jgi:ubiquinone/menaquinone biosynthesis C-methylase UbiE
MEKLYPGKKFVQYKGRIFPFEDKSFEWAYSNAVIEHVGDYKRKLRFLREMVRVAKNVFFTTPNKYFPVDAHTMVFFLHWNDKMFSKWREKNNKWWPQETLNLVSHSELVQLLNDAGVKNYKIIKNPFMGLTMTFSVVIADPDTSPAPGKRAEYTEEKVLTTV